MNTLEIFLEAERQGLDIGLITVGFLTSPSNETLHTGECGDLVTETRVSASWKEILESPGNYCKHCLSDKIVHSGEGWYRPVKCVSFTLSELKAIEEEENLLRKVVNGLKFKKRISDLSLPKTILQWQETKTAKVAQMCETLIRENGDQLREEMEKEAFNQTFAKPRVESPFRGLGLEKTFDEAFKKAWQTLRATPKRIIVVTNMRYGLMLGSCEEDEILKRLYPNDGDGIIELPLVFSEMFMPDEVEVIEEPLSEGVLETVSCLRRDGGEYEQITMAVEAAKAL